MVERCENFGFPLEPSHSFRIASVAICSYGTHFIPAPNTIAIYRSSYQYIYPDRQCEFISNDVQLRN
jgi:hypothetical protein